MLAPLDADTPMSIRLVPALHLVGDDSSRKLHILVDELSDAEAEAALNRLVRERELLTQWTGSEDTDATEDAWAIANAREAVREEPW